MIQDAGYKLHFEITKDERRRTKDESFIVYRKCVIAKTRIMNHV